MKVFCLGILLGFLSVLNLGCQKEISSSGPQDGGIPGPVAVTTTLQGTIFDENNQPLSDVTVKAGVRAVVTDKHGYFRIQSAPLDKNASLVIAEKTGYFKAYRTFAATSGSNHVEIKLVKRALTGTIDAAAGGEATLSNGAKVSLPANGVVLASGGAYTGAVHVYAAYIDPTSADIARTVPGSFIANDLNNRRVTLASYGMLSVELESASGQKLQIKQGSTATLSAPIPSSILSSAPATIALWYVDEQTGIWKEEGSALKQGNSYVGTVKHFTYWNYDIGLPGVKLSLKLTNADGSPLVNVGLKIKRASSEAVGYVHAMTDSLGQASGLVPSGEALVLQLLDPCANVVYSKNIGPFNQATDLGALVADNPGGTALFTLKGKLLSCSNTAVSNGYAMITVDNSVRYATTDKDGNFTSTIIKCAGNTTTAQVIGVDAAAVQQGGAIAVNLTSGVTDAGSLSACGTSAAQYVNYTIDGVNYSISIANSDSLVAFTQQLQSGPGYRTYIQAAHFPNDHLSIAFEHATQSAGTYAVTTLSTQSYSNTTLVQPFNVVVTNFPQTVGEFYEGSISGQFKDAQNVTHTINSSFRLRKQF